MSARFQGAADQYQACLARSRTCSCKDLGLAFVEGLGGLGEGVGDGLVPVHVRAAGAQFPRALFAEGSRYGRGDCWAVLGASITWASAAPWMIAAASGRLAANAPAIKWRMMPIRRRSPLHLRA